MNKWLATILTLAGCPSNQNPATLWLAPGTTEMYVKLVASPPPPY